MTNWTKRLALIAAAVMLVGIGFLVGTAALSSRAAGDSFVARVPTQQGQSNPTTDTERMFSDIYNQVSPSVVNINVVAQTSGSNNGFQQGGGNTIQATGTGFVIDQQGHIVTNNHVVDGATQIEVTFVDGTITRGTVVGVDPNSDLAVIQVTVATSELHPVTFANSDGAFIGQTVLAIGSPFGERWTLTSGIISATDRTIHGLTDFSIGQVIQTDAAINPGNSGGPLLNLQGQVLGVNSQIESNSNSSSGIGFSIPSNLVQRVAQALISTGQVQYSYLGISGGDVDLAIMEALNLPNNTRGVVVSGVAPGSPAAAAGLQNPSGPVNVNGQGVPHSLDIITAINGTQMTDIGSLIAYLANNTQPGQTISLTVLRNGNNQMTIPVTLTQRPQ